MADRSRLVLAPAGVVLGSNGSLHVDDTETSSIAAIRNATVRAEALTASVTTVATGGGLDGPGMTSVANGDLVVVNATNGSAVELIASGRQRGSTALERTGAGDLFGVVLAPDRPSTFFTNALAVGGS